MIKTFGNKLAEDLFHARKSKETRRFPQDLLATTFRKLVALNNAASLEDVKFPPGNRLHKLKDNLAGYWAISINDQWRIIFQWNGKHATDVQVLDYH
jgi:proteic killer suppression protein